ncbi:hypothetical protein D9758_013597 [Tetrapyrgos nigripes]|uniref:Uncharacterized protein n=1 Tax=Tetrapyrgos nigripes TaxID=182062 RepID=A0A8H5C9A1_9AGAR|nr:hypothetical protein D9758_013597 [Tetrapyrgos nigripes]
MNANFFPGAHDFHFDGSTINNIQGDQHQKINNDNRNISGSYNTRNTRNNDSHNSQWSSSDRRDNRRAHTYDHNQNVNLGSEYYSQSQPSVDYRPQPHPQQQRQHYSRQDVPYHPGAWGDGYSRSYPNYYGNADFQSVGGQQRRYQAEPFPPELPYGYPPPRSHYSSLTSLAFHPPHPPASAPPAPIESQEQYYQAHPNPYSQPYTPQSPPRPLSANRAPESTSSAGYNSTSRNPFHRFMESQRNSAGSNSANEDENAGADMDVDNDGMEEGDRMEEGDGMEEGGRTEIKLADEVNDIQSVNLSRDARVEMPGDALDGEWSGESSVNDKRERRDEKGLLYHIQRRVQRSSAVINVPNRSTTESNLLTSAITTSSLECVVPAGIIDWAEQNADLWLKAQELDCQLLPDVCGDHDGWTSIICLRGPYNRDVANYALELAEKSGASVYWIFRGPFDPETGKTDGGSGVNQTSKLEDTSGEDLGASSSSGRGNHNGSDGGNPPGDPGKSPGQNRRNHNIVMSWRESGFDEAFVTTNLTLQFERDEEKVKPSENLLCAGPRCAAISHICAYQCGPAHSRFSLGVKSNRERGVLGLGCKISIEDHGETYKIGLASTVSFFVKGSDVTSIKIFKLPNKEDRGIRKLIHKSSAANSASFSLRNPFSFKFGRNTKNVEEVNNARETPPFYTCHLSAPDRDSNVFGIFPTASYLTAGRSVRIRDPPIDLEINLRPSAEDQPSIHIGMKICLRVERRFSTVARTREKIAPLSTGMMLVHNVTIREAYAPASSLCRLTVELPPEPVPGNPVVFDSDSLTIVDQDRYKYPQTDVLDSVKVELGKANVKHEESSCSFCMRFSKFFKSLAGRSNIHETEHKKVLGYIDTLYRNMEVNMIEIWADSRTEIRVRPTDLPPINKVRPLGF